MENRRNKYDELDKLFRSRLNDNKPVKADWNVPPDSIFEKAQIKLSETKKKKNRSIFLWVLMAILFLSIVGLQLHTSAKIDRLKESINLTNQDVNPSDFVERSISKSTNAGNDEQQFKTESNQTYDQPILAKNIPPNQFKEPKSISSLVTENSIQANSITYQSPLNNQLPDSDLGNSAVNNEIEKNDLFNELLTPINSNGVNEELLTGNQNTIAIENIPGISWKELSYERDEIHIFSLNEILKKEYPSKEKFETYVFSGFTLSSMRMTNTDQNAFSLTKYDKNYLGYQIGIGLKFNLLENLQLNSSLAWSQLHNQSLFQEDMAYDPTNESINPEGEKMYLTDLNVESPMGSYSATVRFLVTDQNISDNDFLSNETDINQDFNLIHLTLGLDYTFLTSNKIDFIASGGLSGNYMSHLNQDMDTKLIFIDQVLMEKSFSSKTMDEVNPYFLSYYGQLGMKYNLSSQFYFQLSGGFENAFTSLRSTKAAVSSSTYLNHFKSQLYLAYRF